jgi:hypothetical protein
MCRIGKRILTGENRSTRRETCPNATLSVTNLTWTDLGVNPGARGDRPAINRLSRGMGTRLRVSFQQMLSLHLEENESKVTIAFTHGSNS